MKSYGKLECYEQESYVKTWIKKVLIRHHVFYFMPCGTLYGKAGIPDFVACVNGKFIGVEAKNSKRKEKGLSALQATMRDNIQAAGGKYFVVYDCATLAKLEEEIEKATLQTSS